MYRVTATETPYQTYTFILCCLLCLCAESFWSPQTGNLSHKANYVVICDKIGNDIQFKRRSVWRRISIFRMQLGLFYALNQSTLSVPPTLTWDSKFSSIYIFICALCIGLWPNCNRVDSWGERQTIKPKQSSLRERFNFLSCLSV